MRNVIESVLNFTASRIFPVLVLLMAVLASIWHLNQGKPATGQVLPLAVWEQPADFQGGPAQAAAHLVGKSPRSTVETRLSAQPFWFSARAQAPSDAGSRKSAADWVVEFPSRHAMTLSCWDHASGQLLGQADRDQVSGRLRSVRSGFALSVPAGQDSTELLCRSSFRGPARISAAVWSEAAMAGAHALHGTIGTMIVAGLGVLTLSMVLTAAINRSALYWAFVGWLFVSMRMALLSEGADFSLFGVPLPMGYLTPLRQWTVCLYFVLTLAVFGLLFRKEMRAIGARWLLRVQRASAVLVLPLAALLDFETFLPLMWVASALLFALTLPCFYIILRRTRSRPALWYASSIIVAQVATLNEIITAATGERLLLGSLNSVTAALASALLACAAVAEHMRADRRERELAQATLKTAYDDSPIGLFSLRDGDAIINCNPAFRSMVRMTQRGGGLLSEYFGPDVMGELAMLNALQASAELELQAKLLPRATSGSGEQSDSERWFSIKASTTDGRIFEGTLQDITVRVRATSRLEFLVNHDPLTECLNLRGLARQFDRVLAPPKTLAYFDLDRFKLINDLYGHAAGDAVLKQVCDRIRSQIGESDLLARVGGDEFVVAFPDASIALASQRCENICALISSSPVQIDSQRFTLSISAGLVAAESFDHADLKEIISAADTLCRVAKKRSSDRLVVMEGGDTFFKHHKVELELISCLERGETPDGLFLVMQPELSLTRPFDSLNFEVLLRMRKPGGEIVPAPVIIEAAEAHGKTAIIDLWVVGTVIAWLEAHAGRLANTQFIGVNLSGSSLNDESFVEDLFRLLEQHERAVTRICIEITETVALTDMVHMQRFIDRARDMGLKVALDDFGAGYSSFGYLKGLSVDALKLDGSLVRDAASNPASMAILSALGGLVSNLGLKSIGEYAENLPILKALVAAGVDYAQGYCISRPVMPERILEARSSADFIEDPEIYAFVRQLQLQDPHTLPLFPDGGRPLASGMLH